MPATAALNVFVFFFLLYPSVKMVSPVSNKSATWVRRFSSAALNRENTVLLSRTGKAEQMWSSVAFFLTF